jgi:hypothetical protein
MTLNYTGLSAHLTQTHSISITNTIQFMPFMGITAVSGTKVTKYIKIQSFIVKLAVPHITLL